MEKLKQILSFVLKYAVAGVLLYYLLQKADGRAIIDAVLALKAEAFLAALLIAALNLTLQFLRWRYLIEQHSSQFSVGDLLPSFLAGFTLRMIVPGGHAEFAKVFMLPGRKRGKILAFGWEKFFQTYLKLVLMLIVLPFFFDNLPLWTRAIAPVLIILFLFLPLLLSKPFIARHLEKPAGYYRIFSQTLMYTFLIYATLIMQYQALLSVLHPLPLAETAATVIFILGSGLIPISVAGLGVRENVALYFFSRQGVPAGVAVGVSLLIFIMNHVLPALAGVIFVIRRRQLLAEVIPTMRVTLRRIFFRE